MTEAGALERFLKKDRWIVLVGLVAVTAVSWLYLIVLAADMSAMPDMASMEPRFEHWMPVDWAFMFVMWVVMMAAMMIPSATPMILLFARVSRQQEDGFYLRMSVFVAGYLLAWTLFSGAATVMQWGLELTALLSPMMVSTSRVLGGVLLIACGAYQFSPWKSACLDHCRSPVHFVMHYWRTGVLGALRMGFEHGLFCVGCCWFLMALLFVGGVMNLLWIAALGAFVLLEKVVPHPQVVTRASGVVLTIAGLWLLLT